MTKELALRPQYAQYSNPNPKPELFGQTRPEVKKPYSSRPDPEGRVDDSLVKILKPKFGLNIKDEFWSRL